MHSEDHFSEEGLFRSRFSKSSVNFKGKWKVRVLSHASVSKYYADKTYANLWSIARSLSTSRLSSLQFCLFSTARSLSASRLSSLQFCLFSTARSCSIFTDLTKDSFRLNSNNNHDIHTLRASYRTTTLHRGEWGEYKYY